MTSSPNTKDLIISSAIRVLLTHGTEGLSMRKVAGEANMSLGNLQYHFRDKAALMEGLGEHYFGECARMLDGYRHSPADGSAELQLYRFITYLLDHVDHSDQVSEMCRVFREMWALSARDAEIQQQLVAYYRTIVSKLSALCVQVCSSKASADQLASLLLPYIEGYSITHGALPLRKPDVTSMLVKLCKPYLKGAGNLRRPAGQKGT